MASWSEFAAGAAELSRPGGGGYGWEPFQAGARELADAGERLLMAAPAGINLLGTVSPSQRPRIHPFMPRVIDGQLWAFILTKSPKARDLESRPYTIHTVPAPEDEEFWVTGHAHRVTEQAAIDRIAEQMEWADLGQEILFEFDLEQVVWTVWLDFGTANHRPQHYRWLNTM